MIAETAYILQQYLSGFCSYTLPTPTHKALDVKRFTTLVDILIDNFSVYYPEANNLYVTF